MKEQVSVLVVDDNEDLLETFSMILKRRGFVVETAPNGVVALTKFHERHFDVTLMDVVMPEMDGVEAFRKMREISPAARVILMTAYSDEELIERALREGAHCVVSKPLRIDRIIEMINEASVPGPILLVDDDTDILETMTRALKKEGYEVVGADSGEQAMVLARQRETVLSPSLILSCRQ
ncbi:response regulator [Chloroflexota bacterium]